MDLSQANINPSLCIDTGSMNFKETQQCSAILEKLQTQREKKAKFCDVIFHVEGKDLYAHRNVLAAFSPYFDATFKFVKMIDHVNINNCRYELFHQFLDYIYTGTVTIQKTTVAEMMKLANQFMLSKLKSYCEEFLERNLSIYNCYHTKAIADDNSLTTLSKMVECFIFAHINDVIEQHEILEFTDHRIESFIGNKTVPLTEEMKLGLLVRWVKHDMTTRHMRMFSLLRHIQWTKINIHVVYAALRDYSLFLENEWCMFFMLQLLEDNNMLLPMYVGTLKHLREKLTPNATPDSVLQAFNKAMADIKESEESSQENVSDVSGANIVNASQINLPQSMPVVEPENMLVPSQDVSSNSDGMGLGIPPDTQMNLSTDITDPNITAPLPDAIEGLESILTVHPEQPEENNSLDLEKHKSKRKGIPIKVKIPKAKIKLDSKVSKKRGRPSKSKSSEPSQNTPKPYAQTEDLVKLDDINLDGFESDLSLDRDLSSDLVMDESSPKQKKKRTRRKNMEKLGCDKCGFYTTDIGKMEKHKQRAHRDDTTYACNVCDYTSTWNRDYYKHMKTHFDGPPFKCDRDTCDWVGDRIQQLLYHRMSHSDERPYSCTVCNMKFRTKNNLATHARCHTGEKPFKCDVCGRSFATKGTLEQHSVTHSDARPYLCDTCGFSTKYQSHLIAHRRIHSGDVFRCQYPNCKYSTPKRSQLACHMRSHMSIRSHICSTCGRGFVEKGHLVRHERIHLESKPFSCELCDYSSTRRDKLKEHVTKYHTDGTAPKTPYKPRKPRKAVFSASHFPTIDQREAQAELDLKMEQATAEVKEIRQKIPPAPPSDNQTSVLTTHPPLVNQPQILSLPQQQQGWSTIGGTTLDPTLTSVAAPSGGQQELQQVHGDGMQKNLTDLSGNTGTSLLLENQLRTGGVPVLQGPGVMVNAGEGGGGGTEFNVLERAFMGMLGI